MVDSMTNPVDSMVDSKTDLLTTNFDHILERLKIATRTSTDTAFTESIGLSRQSVRSARKRGPIPASWIVAVAEQEKVSLDWILYGIGPMRREDIRTSETVKPLDEGSPAGREEPESLGPTGHISKQVCGELIREIVYKISVFEQIRGVTFSPTKRAQCAEALYDLFIGESMISDMLLNKILQLTIED